MALLRSLWSAGQAPQTQADIDARQLDAVRRDTAPVRAAHAAGPDRRAIGVTRAPQLPRR